MKSVRSAENDSDMEPTRWLRQLLSELETLLSNLNDIVVKIDLKLRKNTQFEIITILIFQPEFEREVLWDVQLRK